MKFEFATATQIIFGPGRLSEVGALARSIGKRALLVSGRNPERSSVLRSHLSAAEVEFVPFIISGEPTITEVEEGSRCALSAGTQLVIGLGGGSVLDAGKAIAALATNPGNPLDYLEVIGSGQPLRVDPLPFLAIPTTAGTGSEVTRNAVLTAPDQRVKVSLRSSRMLPRFALIDPELSLGLPPELTAATGLDALTQLLEAFVSLRANPLTDALCRDGLVRVSSALPRAFTHGDDLTARSDLALGALYSGLALANSGLGAVHGLAGAIGGRFQAPHGSVCAALLAPVTAVNLEALKSRQADSSGYSRYVEAARWITGRPEANVSDLVSALRQLVARLHIPGLAMWQVTPDSFPELIQQARQSSSLKGNPIVLTDSELQTVLVRAL